METHPEIPPNCPYFWPIPHDESDIGFGVKGNPEMLWCLCHAKEWQRPVIACVAIKYWNMEACRRFDAGENGDPEGVQEAEEMQQAWEEWGGLIK